MDLVDIFVLVMLVAAAIAAYVIYAVRGGRTVSSEPPVPRYPRIKIKPVSDAPARSVAEPAAVETPTVWSDDPVVMPAPARAVEAAKPEPAATPTPAPPLAQAAALFDIDANPAPATPPSEISEPATPPGEIRWCKQFDTRSEALDDVSRLRLIGDLGVVGKEWCVPLLAQAYQEEQKRSHRQAALTSLAACHSRAAAGTFRAALAAGDPAERAIAADGLADLEPAQQTKIRRTVERF
jgi:hypothetical protein